jgi:hypothetical protein
MLFTISWLIVLTVLMTVSAYFSVQQNTTGHIKWFFAIWAIGIIPMWAIVSRYSKNLSADGLLYDFAITLIYYPALCYFSAEGFNMRWWQIVGFILGLIGMTMVRIK